MAGSEVKVPVPFLPGPEFERDQVWNKSRFQLLYDEVSFHQQPGKPEAEKTEETDRLKLARLVEQVMAIGPSAAH